MMQKLEILNSKKTKDIVKLIFVQWGCEFDFSKYVVLMNNKNKVFIMNRDVDRVKMEDLRINSLGMYLGEVNRGEFRISIEGSQMIGPLAKKGVLDLDDEQASRWMQGDDFEIDDPRTGFMIIKNNSDFLGCGKLSNKKLYNYVQKERRVNYS